MTKIKKKTKAEELHDAVAEAVGAGRELHLESVDFSDPNRPRTCLEVDFPILPINHVATIEGNAGKPIYQMSKWWARRRSSVFRAMLIAAATKAPEDQAEAAKLVWDSYYGNHQKNEAFRKLKVADIFMGGGTTIVEGSRLGMQMYGNDLNPVAWFVVKNEMAQVDPEEVKKLLDAIEAEVKPQIMPFYACDCPRGHKGKWTHKPTGKVMGAEFDPLALTPEEREHYEYFGPEIIYAFWAKHGPCQATGCGHRTPIMSSPVIAIKTLTVKAWTDRSCRICQKEFDIEQHAARMAPAALFVCAPDEKPHSVMDEAGKYVCPHCGHQQIDASAKAKGESGSLVQLNECATRQIAVVGATNYLKKVDPAARRPGRLDKNVFIGPPDIEARQEALRLFMKDRPQSKIKWFGIAQYSEGHSFAELKFVVDEAARTALSDRRPIGSDDLLAVIDHHPPQPKMSAEDYLL
jgi:predicted RNA-binding Zn-ribbon protein involved in translation (DUF1610 family)